MAFCNISSTPIINYTKFRWHITFVFYEHYKSRGLSNGPVHIQISQKCSNQKKLTTKFQAKSNLLSQLIIIAATSHIQKGKVITRQKGSSNSINAVTTESDHHFQGFPCTLQVHSFMSRMGIKMSEKGIKMSVAGACINILSEDNTVTCYVQGFSGF